jgi:hypothetical protein
MKFTHQHKDQISEKIYQGQQHRVKQVKKKKSTYWLQTAMMRAHHSFEDMKGSETYLASAGDFFHKDELDPVG